MKSIQAEIQPPALTRGITARGIAYSRRGAGTPLVLLHGWCLNRSLWMYQEEYLAVSHVVFSPDLPGFGESAGLDGPYDMDRQVSELALFLRDVVREPAVLVGFAFGAAVALTLASRSRDGIRGIVSIGVPSAATAAYDKMPKAMRRDWPEFALRSARAICKSELSDSSLRWLGNMFAGTPLPVAIATVEVLRVFEPEPVCAAVEVPTLFVHGSLDNIVPSSVSARCAAIMSLAKVEIIEDSGHLVPIDKKERLGEIVAWFATDPEAAVKP
jgi:non-heme chloroperoxidase